MRNIESLNFGWEYHPNFRDEFLESWYKVKDPKLVDFPHNNVELPVNGFCSADYQRIFCYRKFVDIPLTFRGKVLLMRFAGVSSHIEVYINGELVSRNVGAFKPFDIDITNSVRYGESNLFVFKVDCYEDEDVPPFGESMDFLTYGGVYREVNLHVLNPEYISDYLITTKDLTATACKWELDIEFSSVNLENHVYAEVVDEESGEIIPLASCRLSSTVMNFKGEISNVKLWDISHPFLYTVRIQLVRMNEVLDELTFKTGFRKLEFTPYGVILNDRKIKLVGLTRNQSYPYVGYAMPKSVQEADADFLKSLGVNAVRCLNGPPSEHFINRCDEVGLLVFEDLLGWKKLGDEIYRKRIEGNLTSMITRDRNHACVAAWGVRIPHSVRDDEFFKSLNELAKTYDPTRHTFSLRSLDDDSPVFEDIFGAIDYTYSKKSPVASVNPLYKRFPYVLAEFMGKRYPVRSNDDEQRLVDHALAYADVLNSISVHSNISGAFGHSMSDFNTHEGVEAVDSVNYFGVSDMFRMPKLAAAVYTSQFIPTPVLEVAHVEARGAGEHIFYAFTNCEYIKLYADGEFVGMYYPNRKRFKNLKNPPIFFLDLLGERLKAHGFSSMADSLAKSIIKTRIKNNSDVLSLSCKVKLALIEMLTGKGRQDVLDLIQKHTKMCGEFVFEGYKDDNLLLTVTRSATKKVLLSATCIKNKLEEGLTYDVAKVELRYVDEHGNVQSTINHPVSITASGSVDIIGPNVISLNGGAGAVYVRTTSREGEGSVSFTSPYNSQVVSLTSEIVCPTNLVIPDKQPTKPLG